MLILCIVLACTTLVASFLAWESHDEAKKYRGLAEEIGDRMNAMLLNQAADTLERERDGRQSVGV